MKKRLEKLSLPTILMAITVSTLTMALLFHFSFFKFSEQQISLASLFKARHALNLDPKLDDRIKIFSIDDITVQKLKVSGYSLNTWSQIFSKIDESRPTAIVIDKVFDEIRSASEKQVNQFVSKMKTINTNISVGSSILEKDQVANNKASEMEFNRPEHQTDAYCKNDCSFLSFKNNLRHYGPSKNLLEAFPRIGTLNKGEIHQTNLFTALTNGKMKKVIPHSAITPFKIRIDESIRVNNFQTYADSEGQVLYNLSSPEDFRAKNYRLLSIFENIFTKSTNQNISKGDIVVILPEMFTGGTDFKSTYYGEQPGGLLLVSLINSALTGKWIKRFPPNVFPWLLALTAFTLFLLGVLLSTRNIVKVTCLIVAAIVTSSFILFVTVGVYIPFASFCLATMIGMGPIGLIKFRQFEKASYKIHAALKGAVSESEVKAVLRNPQNLNIEPRNQKLTVMFIDIVGFSLTAESRPADEVFKQLRDVYSESRKIIHQYGGYVDRSLGDGLLCFFGFNYTDDNEHQDPSHYSALKCARALQLFMVNRNIEAYSNNRPIYPLRIGINTDVVCTGDLGDDQKLDFTVIGNGVNFASRLEGACEHYCILVGEKTYKSFTDSQISEFDFIEKHIKIKHHTNLVKAFEYNPLKEDPEAFSTAAKQYAEHSGKKRSDDRKFVDKGIELEIKTQFGAGKLLNYSANGLAFDLGIYLARGAVVELTFDSADGKLQSETDIDSVFPIFAEVRWSHVASKEKIIHGVSFVNLSQKQREWLFETLIDFLQAGKEAA